MLKPRRCLLFTFPMKCNNIRLALLIASFLTISLYYNLYETDEMALEPPILSPLYKFKLDKNASDIPIFDALNVSGGEDLLSFHNYTKPKIILFWTAFYGHLYSGNGLLNCPDMKCIFTNNRTFADESSALVFHSWDFNASDLPINRYPWQRYIYENFESPHYTFQDLTKLSAFFNWTMTYRLDSDLPTKYGRFVARNSTNQYVLNSTEILGFNKSMVAWIVSNCDTPSKREKYVAVLKNYIDVDIYGLCPFSKLKCDKNKVDECNLMIGQNYKFYLAFENSICTDYTTEKFYSRAHLNTIPIVFSRKIVQNILPNDSFIAADDFVHPKFLAAYLQELAGNDEKYLTYFRWRSRGYIVNQQVYNFDADFCPLCRKLLTAEPRKVYTDIHSWWSAGKCDVNFVHEQLTESWRNNVASDLLSQPLPQI